MSSGSLILFIAHHMPIISIDLIPFNIVFMYNKTRCSVLIHKGESIIFTDLGISASKCSSLYDSLAKGSC